MKRPLAILIASLLTGIAARGQLPIVKPLPPQTNHFAVAAVKGTNTSTWSNDLMSTNRSLDLGWNPSLTSDVDYYILGKGKTAGIYTVTNRLTAKTSTHYPIPAAPLVTTEGFGDKPFLSFTGAAPEPPLYFQAYTTSKGVVSISSSIDLKHWTSGYALLLTTGKNFTITRQ